VSAIFWGGMMPTYTGTNSYSSYMLEASGAASVTLSPDERLLYVARRDGKIDVFSTDSHSLLKTWNIGTSLGGMSVSDDGAYLLVTERSGSASVVHRVSTADGAVQNYTAAGGTGTFYDVEIVDAHTALLTGASPMQLNLDTGISRVFPERLLTTAADRYSRRIRI